MIGDAERNGWLTHHTVLYAHSSCYFSFLIILKDMDPLPGVAFQDDIHRWLEAALVCTDHHALFPARSSPCWNRSRAGRSWRPVRLVAQPFRGRARRLVAQGPCLARTELKGPRGRRGVMRLGLSGPSSVSFCGEVDFRMCLGAGLWTPRGHSQVTVPTGFVSHRRRYFTDTVSGRR